MLIIDCHGHYTTAPAPLQQFRDAQLAAYKDASQPLPVLGEISDDQIRESIEQNQLRLIRERGADMTIFSPRASAMAHASSTLSTSVPSRRTRPSSVHLTTRRVSTSLTWRLRTGSRVCCVTHRWRSWLSRSKTPAARPWPWRLIWAIWTLSTAPLKR